MGKISMREYHKSMDQRMFDFRIFYDAAAKRMPKGARLVEVGIADGASSIFMAETLLNLGNDEFTLYMVDNLAYGNTDQLNTVMRHVQAAGIARWVDILPVDSLNASLHFNDQYLDFVFIDSNHTYELTKAEIRLWSRKIRLGGMLAEEAVRNGVNEVIPRKFRHTEQTEKECGVWWLEIDPYVQLN